MTGHKWHTPKPDHYIEIAHHILLACVHRIVPTTGLGINKYIIKKCGLDRAILLWQKYGIGVMVKSLSCFILCYLQINYQCPLYTYERKAKPIKSNEWTIVTDVTKINCKKDSKT